MVRPKSTQTRIVYIGIITDEVHPYTFFMETLLLEYWMWGCISFVIIPMYTVAVNKN